MPRIDIIRGFSAVRRARADESGRLCGWISERVVLAPDVFIG